MGLVAAISLRDLEKGLAVAMGLVDSKAWQGGLRTDKGPGIGQGSSTTDAQAETKRDKREAQECSK